MKKGVASAEYYREWYKNNKERKKAQVYAYRDKHKEEINAKYRVENMTEEQREERNRKKREERQANREEYNAYQRELYRRKKESKDND